jgi:hypothetical protein
LSCATLVSNKRTASDKVRPIAANKYVVMRFECFRVRIVAHRGNRSTGFTNQ